MKRDNYNFNLEITNSSFLKMMNITLKNFMKSLSNSNNFRFSETILNIKR